MKSQTARRPPSPRNARSKTPANKQKRYSKQTAHVEARRDGTPLIFGWGGHLSRSEKTRIQRRAIWVTVSIFTLLIVVVLVGSWININVTIPNLPITSVNGHQIPQSQYRKMVALKAQLLDNHINGVHGLTVQRDSLKKQTASLQTQIDPLQKQVTTLQMQIKELPPGATQDELKMELATAQAQLTPLQKQQSTLNLQLNDLNTNTIPLQQQNYSQSVVGIESATWLQDDELIREWLTSQSSTVQAEINPSAAQLNSALSSFKADLPSSLNYSHYLTQDGVNDNDIQAMMTIKVRRDNMQTYLASLVVSPAYQVLARSLTLNTMADAQQALHQLQTGGDFGKIAKAKSSDAGTASSGGLLGWKARGQYAHEDGAAPVENWLFDPARKINQLSPILIDNGAFRILQIQAIDPSRAIDSTTLQTLKTNALDTWLILQRALPSITITSIDQNKLADAMNFPPNLPTSVQSQPIPTPAVTTPTVPTPTGSLNGH